MPDHSPPATQLKSPNTRSRRSIIKHKKPLTGPPKMVTVTVNITSPPSGAPVPGNGELEVTGFVDPPGSGLCCYINDLTDPTQSWELPLTSQDLATGAFTFYGTGITPPSTDILELKVWAYYGSSFGSAICYLNSTTSEENMALGAAYPTHDTSVPDDGILYAYGWVQPKTASVTAFVHDEAGIQLGTIQQLYPSKDFDWIFLLSDLPTDMPLWLNLVATEGSNTSTHIIQLNS